MNILVRLHKTKPGKSFIVVITDRYSKLTQASRIYDTTAPLVAACFLNNWVFPRSFEFDIDWHWPQFMPQFFRYVCLIFGIKRIPMSVYKPQSSGQTERYNESVAALLRNYVSDQQKTGIYAYNQLRTPIIRKCTIPREPRHCLLLLRDPRPIQSENRFTLPTLLIWLVHSPHVNVKFEFLAASNTCSVWPTIAPC